MHSHPRLPFIEIVMQIDSLEMRVPVMLNLPLHHEVASGPARAFTNHDLFHAVSFLASKKAPNKVSAESYLFYLLFRRSHNSAHNAHHHRPVHPSDAAQSTAYRPAVWTPSSPPKSSNQSP